MLGTSDRILDLFIVGKQTDDILVGGAVVLDILASTN